MHTLLHLHPFYTTVCTTLPDVSEHLSDSTSLSSMCPCQFLQADLPKMRVHHDYVCCASPSITAVLSNKCGFQLQYQMIFCVWLLAFSPQLCEQLRRYNVVPALSDILQESVKEKVTRIILAAFRVRTPRPPDTLSTEMYTDQP